MAVRWVLVLALLSLGVAGWGYVRWGLAAGERLEARVAQVFAELAHERALLANGRMTLRTQPVWFGEPADDAAAFFVRVARDSDEWIRIQDLGVATFARACDFRPIEGELDVVLFHPVFDRLVRDAENEILGRNYTVLLHRAVAGQCLYLARAATELETLGGDGRGRDHAIRVLAGVTLDDVHDEQHPTDDAFRDLLSDLTLLEREVPDGATRRHRALRKRTVELANAVHAGRDALSQDPEVKSRLTNATERLRFWLTPPAAYAEQLLDAFDGDFDEECRREHAHFKLLREALQEWSAGTPGPKVKALEAFAAERPRDAR